MLFRSRILLTISPTLGSTGMWGGGHIFSMIGIVGIIIGYGIYQPAAYSGVKMLTNSKTSAMGYAMLYALMNLGGFLPGLISPPVRKSFGISGVFWVYSILTVLGLAVVAIFITKKALKDAIDQARADEPDKTLLEKEETEEEKQKMSATEKMKFYLRNFQIGRAHV